MAVEKEKKEVQVFGPGALKGNTSDYGIKYVRKDPHHPKDNQPYILDTESGEWLFLQGLPMELRMEGESSFNAIKAMGRNNPLYQFTGSEDTLKFNISWYANEEDKQDVLRNCQWLYSKTKNDGFKKPPPLLNLRFGVMFRKSKWILVSANYTMRVFDRESGMVPRLASQELEFKRVKEENLLKSDYLTLDL